jgi:ribonucleoside-triphosphate reductase (thioredoxin)
MNSNTMSEYQQFIHTSRYARWLPDEQRRETWIETVDRYLDNIVLPVVGEVPDELRMAIINQDVMPSMRSMMTAGPAAARDNTCMYNCAYLPVDQPSSFAEALFVLLCGTGQGFSVERQEIAKLPTVPKLVKGDYTVVVADSKEGWATAYNTLINLLYKGIIPKWDVSAVRPAGTPLKTFGGRASGPGPLVDLFKFTVETFKAAEGRKLNSLECHDILCMVGVSVVVGGVRRSAMISLSNLSDDRMRTAKSGDWWKTDSIRGLANNSAAYTEKPGTEAFMKEWLSLVESKSGERGIFNRDAAVAKVLENNRRLPDYQFGTNPCGEIILRPRQFCNLTEVVVRATDDVNSLATKCYWAAYLGTIQSTYTYFPFLSTLNSDWEDNCNEERLLGVSLTGITDNPLMTNANAGLDKTLAFLKTVVVSCNKGMSKRLGVPQSTATTCVKPSGTVSQLVDSSSGIHTRHSEYYIRTVRADNMDPMTEFMKAKGFPNEPLEDAPDKTTVFSFPTRAPDKCLTRDSLDAVAQLELWKVYQVSWCEHSVSCTITVREHEWLAVAAWVYNNWSIVSGLSFLPHSDHVYRQAPYQEITLMEYAHAAQKMPKGVDWSELALFEQEDHTKSSQMFACGGDNGSCEIVDIT